MLKIFIGIELKFRFQDFGCSGMDRQNNRQMGVFCQADELSEYGFEPLRLIGIAIAMNSD